jgi:hypothetical protein
MNQQQFEEEEPSPLRSQRMTEDEAKAVIDLWQQQEVESGGLTTRPAVPDVAEGLDVSVEDVQRLLQQVRAKRQAEERRFALEQYEVELEQIRLAEEERKLAEIQRQRAELRRERAEQRTAAILEETPERYETYMARRRYPSSGWVPSGMTILIWIILVFLVVAFLPYLIQHSNGNDIPPSLPNTCGPGFHPVDARDPGYGCVGDGTSTFSR